MPRLLAFLAAAGFAGQALALEKCVGADGKISYADQCAAGTTRAPSTTDEPLVPKPSPGTRIIKPEIKPLPPPAPGAPSVTVVPQPPPASAPAAVVPGAPADVDLVFYEVEGKDEASLIGALNAPGAGHARSSWKLSYQYLPRRGKGACVISNVTTKLELVMALPRWSPPPGTPQELVARWERYVKALMSLQNARLDRARELERALKATLAALAPAADCAALDAAARERYDALEQQAMARDAEPGDAGTLLFE